MSIFIRAIIVINIYCLCFNTTYAKNYTYEKREVSGQVIHIVELDPAEYRAALVKANGGIGRETVLSIAKNANASVAINGGYFEINKNIKLDGRPSGTLIINHKIYQVKNYKQALIAIKSGKITITEENPKNIVSRYSSIVSGLPMLISNGKIAEKLTKQTSAFYTQPHARTALGIKLNGEVVIVVAEQGANKTNGLSLLQLALLMQSLGCKNAINLDGGGSSTLYLNGKIKNLTIGDKDEANGVYVMRPVSDAIVFKH